LPGSEKGEKKVESRASGKREKTGKKTKHNGLFKKKGSRKISTILSAGGGEVGRWSENRTEKKNQKSKKKNNKKRRGRKKRKRWTEFLIEEPRKNKKNTHFRKKLKKVAAEHTSMTRGEGNCQKTGCTTL